MGANVNALKALYVALGGSADDVANMSLIADVINAIAEKVATLSLGAELPENPTANGTYNLQAVKSNSGTAISWASVG